MKSLCSLVLWAVAAVFAVFIASAVFAGEPRCEWRVVALDDRNLALTGDPNEAIQDAFLRRRSAPERAFQRRIPGWANDFRFNIAGTEAIAEIRPRLAALLQNKELWRVESGDGTQIGLATLGAWMNPVGQARFPDENGVPRLSRNADVVHFAFLEFERPLRPNERLSIRLPNGQDLPFVFRPDEESSPLFKINQVGYAPRAGRKFAYVGAWRGSAGQLPMKRHIGKTFELVDAESGKIVFRGSVVARREDPTNKNGEPFTGEEVAELDFSAFSVPGSYFLRIPGIGKSDVFPIDERGLAEAFYIHARGLYHKRCGIAKERPFTFWICPACHNEIRRGVFPPHDRHYGKGGKDRDFGFFTRAGESRSVNHFRLIEENSPHSAEALPVQGGWHDAADCDRRPQHMAIVGDLCAVWLLKPQNFSDGQLNIPESGNGIPDILDEAAWGLEHLRRVQQKDGGIGTWIETTRHPRPEDGLPSDEKLVYSVSCATRASSMEYAAYASLLAVALKKAGADAQAALFRDSAKLAWDFAMNPGNRCVRVYQYYQKTIFYREPKNLPAELVVKAAANLATLYDDSSYVEAAQECENEAREAFRKEAWRWSPFFWMELADRSEVVFRDLAALWEKRILSEAEKALEQQEGSYPYRIAWPGARDAWVHAMAWGNALPLKRALTFIAAHALTGRADFLDAAFLANDWHNGVNPCGTTLTSGLGKIFPVQFLDLTSYADGIAEFVPGITPFRNVYGIDREDVKMAHGLFFPPNRDQRFPGLAVSIEPETGLSENEAARRLASVWPIWRRWSNLEGLTVPSSEYTVETIGAAAAATGYLLDGARMPEPSWLDRKPADDVRRLPGFAPLP